MLVSSVIISELEFLTGYVVNIRLGLNVWDYSDMPLNLAGADMCALFYPVDVPVADHNICG